MSGFVVSVNGDGAPVDGALLERMTRALAHRGPDALRVHTGGCCGVSHALNVVSADEQNDAAQFSIGNDLWLSGDFRLDDRESLISAIRGHGDSVQPSASDGALLLAAYRAFGTDCVKRLRGDFAFAIWDLNRKQLFLARDRFGVKPLFYACRNGAFCAASSLDTLRLLPFVSSDLDDQAMVEFLAMGLPVSPDKSAFADIHRIPPGHAMTFENGKLRSWQYWSLAAPGELRYRQTDQYLEHFREVMQRSVNDRVRGDSVGIHLSGGIDSGVIAASVANSSRTVNMRGYTVVFDHLIPDEERRFASDTAKHLGFQVEFLSADAFLPFARWERTPEPIHDPFYFNQRTQYRDLIAHSRVALSGHGGDELMLGSYVADLYGRLAPSRILKDLLTCLLVHRVRPPLGIRTVWRRRRRGPTPGRLPPPWIRQELVQKFDLQQRVGALTADWAPSSHPVRPQAFRHFASTLWPAFLDQEDANFTGFPAEVRYPFFDLRVVEFLLALPPLPWCVDKFIARQAMKNLLPDSIRQRRKAPVAEDVLSAHLRGRNGRQAAAVTIPPELSCYIDINALPPVEQLLHSADALWLRMAPVSLGLWLEHSVLKRSKLCESSDETDRPRQNEISAREATLP